MSILIEGMEMPTGCISCDFCNPFVEEPYCRRLMKRVPRVTRLDNCPLSEVPEPHGRLIDADALCASHKEVCSRSMKFNLDLAQTVIPASKEAE